MLSDYLVSPALNALFVTGILLMIIITLFLMNIRFYLKETYLINPSKLIVSRLGVDFDSIKNIQK